MASVLCTGTDELLMSTRKMLLEGAGHSVTAVMDEKELITACEQQDFDVAVIGQSLHPNEKRRIIKLVREHCPSVKVLELFRAGTGSKVTNADDWLEVPATLPSQLAERVTRLATKK